MSPAASIARIYRGTPPNLAKLARCLQAGELVAVPTETVYGLAANALDAKACRKIFMAKGRPVEDPLIVHIHSLTQLFEVAKPNDAALRLAREFWPGPLTMVLPKKNCVPGIVSAGLSTVAVRMPAHPLFRRLLQRVGVPLAAPSANQFGYVSPTTAEHVRTGLGKKIRHILDGGPCAIGVESTIVDLRKPRSPRLLRPGAITREQVEAVLGLKVRSGRTPSAPPKSAQVAPGLMAQHYSPRTPVTLRSRLSLKMAARGTAKDAWVFQAKPRGELDGNIFWFDLHGKIEGVARRLFSTLRALDAGKFKRLHVELAPGEGLATAINDRLRRAAAKK
ncbi:MAG: Sua5/YciO/YrdC/YwlC family protein [Verrucomicrobia bacterium]|nr:Sua5/YciO/YrdC/YwlC family protein [Verrucomicrobiota bacterium]